MTIKTEELPISFNSETPLESLLTPVAKYDLDDTLETWINENPEGKVFDGFPKVALFKNRTKDSWNNLGDPIDPPDNFTGACLGFHYGQCALKFYLNGKLHTPNDPKYPAIVQADGHVEFYQHGKLHRDNGPASFGGWGGNEYWYQHDELHKEDGPAEIFGRKKAIWWKHGIVHRDGDLPAITHWGDLTYIKNGLKHRENGPAVVYRNGSEEWWFKGIRHCTTGPAVTYKNSQHMREYPSNSMREDAPKEEYWVGGNFIGPNEFLEFLKDHPFLELNQGMQPILEEMDRVYKKCKV